MTDVHDTFSAALLDIVEEGPVAARLQAGLDASSALVPGVIGMQMFDIARGQDLRHLASARIDPSLCQLMEGEMLSPAANPVVRDLRGLAPGRLRHIGDFTDWNEYLASEVYDRFSRPAGALHSGIHLVRLPDTLHMFSLGMNRRRSWLDSPAIKQITTAQMQLSRAVQLGIHRSATCSPPDGHIVALLIDKQRRPICASQEQVAAMRSGGVLSRSADGTVAAGQQDTFATLVAEAFCGHSSAKLIIGPDSPWRIEASPGPRLYGRPTVRLDARPAQAVEWNREELKLAYNLTLREAEVTMLLLAGLTGSDAARQLGLRSKSVRIYLGRVFEKVGVHSQPTLVAALSKPC